MNGISSLTEKYRHKIVSVEQLIEKVGEFPRAKKVIMCHGVFDVVHPGHVRHLLFAKSKADILVASITADQYISKGIYRPHVPQQLRAVNLAAFELVDYVIIDQNPTPLSNIASLKPDYFAKGYEYISSGLPPKTAEEASVVKSYGGEIIFTPGDIVYSSSNLIEQSAPRLKIDKLLMLMEAGGITFNALRETLDLFKGKQIHIVGDTIVDSYTRTTMIGGQTKTPTMSVLYQGRTDYCGGAAIVAKHLRAAGADVVFTTVLGDDYYKDFVLSDLNVSQVECKSIIDPTRPTSNKNAIVANDYRLLKIDTLENSTISDPILEKICESIRTVPCDAVIFSDFRHGIFNRRTIPRIIDSMPSGVYRVADSQVASRWGNITDFSGFDLITPNEREARFALADQDSGIRPLAARLYDEAKCKLLILKLGDRGVLTCHSSEHESPDSFFVVESFVEKLVDAVGAGDALLAYATLAMVATKSEIIATILGCIAAACLCEMDGNVPITPDLVIEKVDYAERQARYLE